jgi:hypothetical protein
MADWNPLQSIWEDYGKSLDSVIAEGLIQDEEVSDQYIWPPDLRIAGIEQDEVKRYVHERVEELYERIKQDRGINADLLANIIFRSVLVGMMWEYERVGR